MNELIKNKSDLIEGVYNSDFVFRDKLDFPEDVTFGVEIEFANMIITGLTGKKRGDNWTVEKDMTISVLDRHDIYGGELISPILNDNIESWKAIKDNCQFLKRSGARNSLKAGGHVHVGSQIFGNDPSNIRRFLKLWELFEEEIFVFSAGEYEKTRACASFFAGPIAKNLYSPRNLNETPYCDDSRFEQWLLFFHKMGFFKFSALNFSKFSGSYLEKNNTIEIRCANGSLNPIVWQNNINLFIKLFLYSRSSNYDEELIDHLLLEKDYINYGDFSMNIDKAVLLANIVFDKEIDKLLFLKQYMKMFSNQKSYMKTRT